jgi:O-antigen/teichoic acid export membrane protein
MPSTPPGPPHRSPRDSALRLAAEIGRDTLYLAASSILVRAVGFLATAVLIRYLGLRQYGDLTLAYAYAAFFSGIANGGLDVALIRLARREPGQLGWLVGSSLWLRAVLGLFTCLIAASLLPLWGYSSEADGSVRLALGMFLVSPPAVARVVFMFQGQIKRVAVLDLLGQLIGFACVLLVPLLRLGGAGAVLGLHLVGMALGNGLYWLAARQALGRALRPWLAPGAWRVVAAEAWPVAAMQVLYLLHAHAGRLLIGSVLGSEPGALYSAAFGLATMLRALPELYFASVFPRLVHAHAHDAGRFRALYRLSFAAAMSLLLPFALLLSLTAPAILRLYAGEAYAGAAGLLAAFVWLEVLQGAGTVLYYTCLAAGQQPLLLRMSVVLAVVRVGAQALLLPRWGLIGVAAADAVMHLVAFVGYGLLRSTRPYIVDWLRTLRLPAVALALTALGLTWQPLPATATWLVGGGLYAGAALALGRARGLARAAQERQAET